MTYSDSPVFDKFIPEPTQSDPKSEQPEPINSGSSPLLFIVAIITATIGIGVLFYFIAKIPRTIGESGQKITRGGAKALIPVLAHSKKMKYRQEQKLVGRLSVYIKMTLVVLPMFAVLAGYWIKFPLEYSVAIISSGFLSLPACLLFALQLLFAKLLDVDKSLVW